MLTNTDATIYHRQCDPVTKLDHWKREYIPEVWWYKNEKSSVTTEGLKQADVYTVRIPGTIALITKGDYIVKGNCTVLIQSVKDLAGLEYAKVTSANYNQFGHNPHIKVVGV